MSNTVYLVDGSGYIFRAYYAITALRTKDGFPTNALYGFTRMLLKLLVTAGSEHVVVVFDAGRETFRNELYKEYKANRSECPEDLQKQMPYFREIATALGLKILELPGYEADDIIGTLTKRFEKSGDKVVIVTGDKDFMQLVGEHVGIWDTLKDKLIGEKEVREKFGVEPGRVIEVLGLMGDSSDNVPGLKGVGPKTATQLIENFGNIETLIASPQAVRNDISIRNRTKIAEQIELDAELLRLSRKLVTIDTQAPVSIEYNGRKMNVSELSGAELNEAALRTPPDKKLLASLVERFEFSSLFKDLNIEPSQAAPDKASDQLITRTIWKEDLESWLKLFSKVDYFSFDLETTSLNVLEAKVVGMGICWSATETFYLPFAHKHADQNKQIDFAEFLKAVRKIFENKAIRKCGQNLKYDIGVLAEHGVEVLGLYFDTMLAAYLLNPDRTSVGLSSLAHDYLKISMLDYQDLVGDQPDFSYVDVESAARYCGSDANAAWRLSELLQVQLEKNELTTIFSEIEMPLISVLSRIERRGVKLDVELLSKMSQDFEIRLENLRSQLFVLAGCEFNLNSPKQVSDILFNKLGLSTKGLKKTKTGYSTDWSVLQKLSSEHVLPRHMLEYRLLHKLKSTYIDALPVQVSAKSGRLHTKLNQTGTGTGRLSSSEPNLQNIPIQDPEGREIRRAFIAEKGNVLISADYSQIELRILAHMSADENLIAAFMEGLDIHSKTAREIMRLDEHSEVSPELRRIAKTINFGIIYGMGGFRLARELGIPVAAANRYIEDYFSCYPRVKELFKRLEDEASTKGYVTTILGRRRVVSDIDSSGRDQRFLIRAAQNAPLQGSAADLIKLAMVKLDAKIRQIAAPMSMILQIHDELLFECKDDFRDQAIALISQEMENAMKLMVPLKVDIGWGQSWMEAH